MQQLDVSRRDFLRTTVTAVGGFTVAFYLPGSAQKLLAQTGATKKEYPPNAFVHIAPDNKITFVINKLEMGQGVNTSMAQLIAEELDCDWTLVSSVSAPVDPVYNHPVMGIQMTGGSTALISSYQQHREIGAAMRMMLIDAAAAKWNVPAKDCHTEKSFVIHPKKGKLSYGELADAAQKLPLPTNPKLKDPKNFKVIGKSVKRVDAKDKSNGTAIFGLDVRLPGMMYAVIARPPVGGAVLTGVKDTAARAVPGVADVVKFGDSVAVLGRNTWAAKQGRDALELTWDMKGQDKFSNESLMADFKAEANKPGIMAETKGDMAAGMQKATRKVVAEYEFPYLAHACLEPMNCTINYDGTMAEIWSGHQMPGLDRDAAAKVLGLAPDKVRVNTVYAGGSFGRRANKICDYVVEAAALAKVVRKPLKVVWTREDDMKGGFYRPMNYHKAEIAFDDKNNVLAWKHRIVGQSIMAGSPFESFGIKNGVDSTVVEGVTESAYALPAFSCELTMPKPNMTTLWWRSVGHTHTAYVMETMVDVIAHEMKKDPFVLRRAWLQKSPRHMAVLDLLDKNSGWRKKLPKGHAWGLAVHESFNTVVGHVAEVSYENGQVKVHRITSAVHCGQVVNPEGARIQVESAIVYGLSGALYGEVKIEKGQVVTSNFHEYLVMRMPDMPKVDVHFVPSHDNPTGLGEPGLPPIAPAVANALFTLTGKRLRRLPFSKELTA